MSLSGKSWEKYKKLGIDKGPSQDADSFRWTRVSLRGKCSLGRISSSINSNEIRLVFTFCLHIHYITYICIIFKFCFRRLTWFVRLASAL